MVSESLARRFDRSDKGACTDSQRVVGPGTDNRNDLKSAVKKYKPYGETPTGYALQRAGEDLGSQGQRTIVLVSDGEPTCASDPCAVARQLGKRGIDLKIEVVGLDVSGKARSILQCIADAGHGHYYDANDADDIGAAMQTVATRSLRPYKPMGKPITGGTSAVNAPLLAVGDWTDKLGGDGSKRGELYYTVRRSIPGSTFHVSASITTKKDWDGVTVEMDKGREKCGYSAETHPERWGQLVSTGITVPGSLGDDECRTSDALTVKVSRGAGASHTAAGKDTVPLELRVDEEPPVTNSSSLPTFSEPKHDQPSFTSPNRIAGASSFSEATDIKPGAYSGNIVPGEVQLFALPVGWGQNLNAAARVKKLNTSLGDEIGVSYLSVMIFSPSRALVQNSMQSEPTHILTSDGVHPPSHATSFAVAYRNRTHPVDTRAAAGRAGTYCVAVSLSSDDGKTYQVPYELAVDVAGTVRGKPTYKQASPSPTPRPATPTTRQLPANPSQTGSAAAPKVNDDAASPSRVGWIVGGIGTLAAIGAGTALIVHLVRRRDIDRRGPGR